ncbi:MAG: putative hydro-lyase [Afipia sp.]|nr:putative hydro-lyase [Afipia sp.]
MLSAAELVSRSVHSHDADLPSRDARLTYRSGIVDVTSGVAPGYVQGNLAIVPESLAASFHRFCQLNPKPCPIIGMSEVGDPRIPALGIDLDIRTDIPRYRVWRNGQLIEEPTDIMAHWRDDLVAFVIGCSFSFEEALIADGLSIRHIDEKRNVPMYRTSIACKSARPFEGRMVVSMRPFKPAEAIRAIQITTRFPSVHGAPVHIGKPELIGIEDIAKPDYGDAVSIQPDELPVFWACGVTPQSVILQSRPAFAITHAPGYMLVTDVRNSEFSIQ